jgi:hypothetical protein
MDLNRLYRALTDWLQRDRAGSVIRLSDFDRLSQQLRPGDVLLIDGRSPLDETLKTVASSRWSRVALYLGRLHQISDPTLRRQLSHYLPCHPDTGLILQARLDTGVVLQPLTSLGQEHLRICRPRGLRDAAVDTALRHAISRLGVGTPRSWFAVFTLLLPWGLLPRRWRCSTFAALAGSLLRQVAGTPVGDAFAFVQFPVLPLVKSRRGDTSRLYSRQPGIYFAADFDHSPYMDVIKYPFVDQIDNSHVRLQPWHGDADGLGPDVVAAIPVVRLVEHPRSATE